ncbi:MAG: Txe/YoeB family addiction module toxin [Melioribacteraceae bacterium]
MVKWKVVFTKQALKDAKKINNAGLRPKAEIILSILEKEPLQNPPPYEKLLGDLTGAYSRRINIQHRVVYQIYKKLKTVKVIRMWTHYE